MYTRLILVLLVFVSLSLQGCGTFEGAKEGFKKDWKDWNTADDWAQENMW